MDPSPSPPCPQAGTGVHDWILTFTRTRLLSGFSEDQVFEAAFEGARHSGRAPNHLRREIRIAIAGAVRWIADHPDIVPGSPGGLLIEQEAAVEMAWASYCPDDSFRDIQPPPRACWQLPIKPRKVLRIIEGPEPAFSPRPEAAFSIGDLYGDYDFILCLADSIYRPRARGVDFWEGRPRKLWGRWQWMVPNPCLDCGEGGWVKSDDNADERIWLIIEFDRGSLSDQGKLLAYLGDTFEGWELAMVVYSGGKSLHGWFSTVGKGERHEIFPFFREATILGADLAMSSSVQYTRVPWGTNTKTGRRQEIVHYDPAAIERHNANLNAQQETW